MEWAIYTFAIIGVLATVRFLWQLRKLVAAAWRLRKSIRSFQANRRTALFQLTLMDEINRRCRNTERERLTKQEPN